MSSKKDKRQRGNLKQNRALGGVVINHAGYVETYRKNVMKVLREVREGTVEEEQLDKLHNFCLMALAVLDTVDMRTIQKAWTTTELLSFYQGGDAFEGVHDEDKINLTLEVPKDAI